jgi:phage-related tail protein
MSNQVSFWQRVGNIFRGGRTLRPSGNGNGQAGEAVLEPQSLAAAGEGVTETPTATSSSPGLMRWGRREPTLVQVRDGYQRVLETMDALQEHFHRQDERTAQLGESVDRMVGILDQLAETGRNQQEHVRRIAENVSEAGQHTAAMSASLSQMPRSLQLQTEALKTVLRQMESSQQSDTQLMQSLERLSGAADALNASGAAQVQTLERLDSSDREQKQALTVLVREQGRRFLIIMGVAALLGLGALAALAVTMWLQFGR